MTAPEYGGYVLQVGDEGENTLKVQKRLQERGYRLRKVDGIFGAETERAVKKFQHFAGLTDDGIVGPRTWAALWEVEITP